jgi:hypothetical protein
MSKKKEKEHKEIGSVTTLRIYDTGLIERLNAQFKENSSRYEHRNHFLTDLIEAGLSRRDYENNLKDDLLRNDMAVYKSVDELAEWLMEFGKYVRTQFQSIQAADFVFKTMLSSTYNMAEAAALRKTITSESVGKGAF